METTDKGGTATLNPPTSATAGATLDSASNALRDVARAYVNLLGVQMRLGRDLLGAVMDAAPPELSAMARTATRTAQKRAMGAMGAAGGCCDVPPPCWMPRLLDDVVTCAPACRTARVTLVITNCGATRRAITIAATGGVKVEPASVTLPPFGRQTVTLSVDVPQGAAAGSTIDSVVVVRGCREWVLRWTAHVREGVVDPAPSVAIDDCPDFRHHWYDHFYCARPCLPDRTPDQPPPNTPPGAVGGIAANG
jgi:hypothetical protein